VYSNDLDDSRMEVIQGQRKSFSDFNNVGTSSASLYKIFYLSVRESSCIAPTCPVLIQAPLSCITSRISGVGKQATAECGCRLVAIPLQIKMLVTCFKADMRINLPNKLQQKLTFSERKTLSKKSNHFRPQALFRQNIRQHIEANESGSINRALPGPDWEA
jgi:hypothetical protein